MDKSTLNFWSSFVLFGWCCGWPLLFFMAGWLMGRRALVDMAKAILARRNRPAIDADGEAL